MPRCCTLVVVPAIFAASALAEPAFNVTLNPAQSHVTATLTVQGQSGTDTSPIAGTMRIRLSAAANPATVELHDFSFNATEPLDISIIFRIFSIPIGSIVVNASDVQVMYAEAGVIEGPVPVTANQFTFTDVPADTAGTTSYTATGTVCTLLQSQSPPQACSGMINLADTGTQNASTLPGSVTIVGRTATVSGTINITGPINPDDPTFGTLAIAGTFVGSGSIPYCPGDFDQSGAVAVPDIFAFLSAWFAALPSADLDGTPGVTVPDIFTFLARWFAPCA